MESFVAKLDALKTKKTLEPFEHLLRVVATCKVTAKHTERRNLCVASNEDDALAWALSPALAYLVLDGLPTRSRDKVN
jgi:hypothetical protein